MEIISKVINAVCEITGTKLSDVISRRRIYQHNILPRFLVFTILKYGYKWSLMKIGESFKEFYNVKAFNHATVLNGINKIRYEVPVNKKLREKINTASSTLEITFDYNELLHIDC
jgi:chromosomal replication initiation ATPase DnaA